jgi:hypothetical protein
MLLASMYGWGFEPSVDPDAGHGDHGDGHDDGHPAPDQPGEGQAAELGAVPVPGA